MRDAHDDLMLTDRPTTVVHQATALHDRMPDLCGSSEDEENLFASTGANRGSYLGDLQETLTAGAASAKSAMGSALTDENAANTVKGGGSGAMSLYEWLASQPVEARQNWLRVRPLTTKALDAYIPANKLPPLLPRSSVPFVLVGLAALGLFFYLRKA